MMPDGEEAPGEQRPAAGLDQPPLAQPAGDEGGDGEGEGHGEADVAQVEHRRVEGHQRVVLQQRVGARAVERGPPPRPPGTGWPGPAMSRKKKAATTRPVSVAHATSGSVARLAEVAGHHRQVAGQHQRPQQDRALEGRPHAGDRVEQRRAAAAVAGHVVEREVVAEEGRLHGHGGHAPPPPARPTRSAGPPAGGGRRPAAARRPRVTTPRIDPARPRATAAVPEDGVHGAACGRPARRVATRSGFSAT